MYASIKKTQRMKNVNLKLDFLCLFLCSLISFLFIFYYILLLFVQHAFDDGEIKEINNQKMKLIFETFFVSCCIKEKKFLRKIKTKTIQLNPIHKRVERRNNEIFNLIIIIEYVRVCMYGIPFNSTDLAFAEIKASLH